MRCTWFAVVLALCVPGAALAKTAAEFEQEANDAASDIANEDVDEPADDAAGPTGQVGGCRQKVTGKMSLLGVEYGGGPDIPKGEIRNLRDDDPAYVNLVGKDKVINKLEQDQRKAAAEAFAGIDQPSWNQVTTWEDGVGRVEGRILSLEANIKDRQESVGNNERWLKGSQEDLARAKDADERERANNAIASYKEEIAKLRGEIAERQKEIAFYEQRLPALQKGLAAHTKAMTPASAARKQAEEIAKREAAKCP